MSDARHVNANLMCPPRLQTTGDKGVVTEPLKHLKMGRRGLAVLTDNRHFLAIRRMPSDVPRNDARALDDVPVYDGAVLTPCLLVPNLAGEEMMCHVVFRGNHHARGILIEAMNDAGAQVSVDPREIAAVMEQCVDERPRIYARGRVHDHAARLVDDDNVRILIEDIQRDVLCTDLNRLCRRDGTRYALAATQLKIRLAPLSVHRYVSLCDEALCVAAREGRQLPHEEYIQPFPCLIGNKCAHGRNSFFCTKSAQRTQIVPTTMAMSAILNTGHTRKSMKSMTCAKRIRSAMLLSAPAAKATLP